MKDFNDNTAVADFIIPRPATYALNKLETFEYVELWYFTQEGCVDAMECQRSQNDDAFGIIKTGDTVALKQLAPVKAWRNAVKDADLTWRQMSMGRISFLQHAEEAQWPPRHISALAKFFVQLEIHQLRYRHHGEKAIIIYQVGMRRNWHDKLKHDIGFNISIINETLMQNIYDDVLKKIQLEGVREVSHQDILPEPSTHSPHPFFPLSLHHHASLLNSFPPAARFCFAPRFAPHPVLFASHPTPCSLLHISPHASCFIPCFTLHIPSLLHASPQHCFSNPPPYTLQIDEIRQNLNSHHHPDLQVLVQHFSQFAVTCYSPQSKRSICCHRTRCSWWVFV